MNFVCHLGLDATKPVFGVSVKAKFKPVSSATETCQKIEISLVKSLDMILYNKRITKALIRLRSCAGWSAPLWFANLRRQVFTQRGPFNTCEFTCDFCESLFATSEMTSELAMASSLVVSEFTCGNCHYRLFLMNFVCHCQSPENLEYPPLLLPAKYMCHHHSFRVSFVCF